MGDTWGRLLVWYDDDDTRELISHLSRRYVEMMPHIYSQVRMDDFANELLVTGATTLSPLCLPVGNIWLLLLA